MRAFSVKWLETDETVITFNKEFEAQSWILKADILKDAIYELNKKYQKVLSDEEERWESR
jgi:hypothetical protein